MEAGSWKLEVGLQPLGTSTSKQQFFRNRNTKVHILKTNGINKYKEMEKEKLEETLINKVHEKLSGHIEIAMNQIHFEELHQKTGISIRKLKELFGIYKKRSTKSYAYTMSLLAQFIGFSDWNSFVRHEVIKAKCRFPNPQDKEEAIHINKEIEIDPNKDQNITISVYVRGR